MTRRFASAIVSALTALLVAAPPAIAQQSTRQRSPLRPELRLDALAGPAPAVQLGAGLVIPAGYYVRVGADVGAGPAWHDGTLVGSARADLVARFLLDPFRQSRWGLSVGGGVSVRHDAATGTHPWLVVLADLEGPPGRHVTPAFQLGLGGGVRAGVILRRTAPPFRR